MFKDQDLVSSNKVLRVSFKMFSTKYNLKVYEPEFISSRVIKKF